MALQGTLDTFALPDVLRLLAATRKTGRLLITGAPGSGSAWVQDGSVVGVQAEHAPHATEAVDALFELLRFKQGSFTFEADVASETPSAPMDPEALVTEAEGLLSEWREIERVVPSMDAWVTLRRALAEPEVTIGQGLWTTIVAIGGGATVRTMCDDLRLAELPMSRSVRDLCELGLVDVDVSAPADQPTPAPPALAAETEVPAAEEEDPPAVSPMAPVRASAAAVATEPVDVAPAPDSTEVAPVSELAHSAAVMGESPLPTARPLRARRAKGAAHLSSSGAPSSEPERFVPLDLPGQGPQLSYDPIAEPPTTHDAPGAAADAEGDGGLDAGSGEGLAAPASLPALSAKSLSAPDGDQADEPARRLAPLAGSAGETTSDDAAEAAGEPGSPAAGVSESASRGLLVKLRSSVKG